MISMMTVITPAVVGKKFCHVKNPVMAAMASVVAATLVDARNMIRAVMTMAVYAMMAFVIGPAFTSKVSVAAALICSKLKVRWKVTVPVLVFTS